MSTDVTADRASEIPALVRRLRRGGGQPAAQLEAMRVLHGLASLGNSFRHSIAAAGAIPLLVSHLSDSRGALQGGAGRVLVFDQPEMKTALLAAGGLQPVLACLRSPHVTIHECAALLAGNLMHTADGDAPSTADDVQDAVLAANGAPRLVSMIGSSDISVQGAASSAVCNLARRGVGAEAAVRAGAIAPLVSRLQSSDVQRQQRPYATSPSAAPTARQP